MVLLSLVVPTYNEKENISRLIPEVFRMFRDNRINGELIIVDDNSPDGTADAASSFSGKYDIKVLKRKGKLGLSSAVLDGFSMARGDILGVMDADFSHPVEKIPEMLAALKGYDFVIGSRLVKGGGVENWPAKRRVISAGARLLARGLTCIKDTQSGFFLIKRPVLEQARSLNPRGFKICLELLVKGRYSKAVEIPITFKDRVYGQSKLGKKVIFSYIIHVMSLYLYKIRNRSG